MEDSVWVEKDLAVSYARRCSRLWVSSLTDQILEWISFYGGWVNHEQHIISCLLLKFDIASTLSMLVETFHFNHTVHGCAFVFSMSRVANLRLIFEEGVIVVH